MKMYHWSDSAGQHWEFCYSLAVITRTAAWVFFNWPRYTQAKA